MQTVQSMPLSGYQGDFQHREKWLLRHSHRVRILIAANEALRVLPLFEDRYPEDTRPCKAIEVAYLKADAAATEADAAHGAYADADDEAYAAKAAAYAAAYAADDAAYADDDAYADESESSESSDSSFKESSMRQDCRFWQYLIVQGWRSEWATSNTVALAHQMYELQEWSIGPYLADALMDAGCDNDGLLHMLRECWEEIGRGCWIIDKLRGIN